MVIYLENLNNVFFDEYKRLERLCNDIFGVTNGVTCYIDNMNTTRVRDRRGITDWDVDLKRLIQLRHKRNMLSHEAPFNEPLCTQEDIDWLCNFYSRIINREDPLALAANEAELQYNASYDSGTTSTAPTLDLRSFLYKALPFLIILAIVIFLFFGLAR